MKKLIVAALSALLAFSGLVALNARAAMDNTAISISAPGTNATAGAVSVIRGDLRAVRVSCPAGVTGSVVLTASVGTVLTISAHTGTAIYFPRATAQSNAGGATNALVTFPLASTVTSVFTQVNTTTNTWTAELIYDR